MTSTAARLLTSARRRAGLTQRALARRARTSQSVIARIEGGASTPGWRTLEHLVNCAGFELRATLGPRLRGRSHMLEDVARILRLTPEERLLELRNAARLFASVVRGGDGAFDPERILRTLARRRVRYVLAGATAARLQGFPRVTAAADVAPATDTDNLKCLASALRDLRALVYTESMPDGLAFSCDAETLARSNLWNLVTDAGRLDLIFKPSGTEGCEDLARSALTFQVFGVEVRAASLEDILRSKRALSRPQDQQDVLVLTEMLKRR